MEINAARRHMENQNSQVPCDFNFRGRTMDLSVQEQRHRALMAGIARILMRPGMESGHRRHELDQQEGTQAKEARTAFGGAHDPSSRRWRHGGDYATVAAPLQQLFL
jgi:hypothetical protein